MQVSRSQRLRKAAAKAVKRKAIVAEKLAKERRELRTSRPRHVDLATSPLVFCSLSAQAEKTGLGTLTVARKLPLGRYAVAEFLLDLWCMGVSDLFFRVDEDDVFEHFRELTIGGGEAVPIEPARARLLVREAAAYGKTNGFPPPVEFGEMESFFGDVEAAGEPFAFGDNGRTHYVVGEFDLRGKIEYVLATLTKKLGPGGFEVTYPLEDGGSDEDKEPLA
jgi:hypothetical protein